MFSEQTFKVNNILRYIIKMIYITFDTSIPHYSTWQLIVETLKTATYGAHTVTL